MDISGRFREAAIFNCTYLSIHSFAHGVIQSLSITYLKVVCVELTVCWRVINWVSDWSTHLVPEYAAVDAQCHNGHKD